MKSTQDAEVFPKLLLTSICRPIGPKYGDGDSVGYELLHSQVTRRQGIFSPRAVHRQFSLDYIAANLDNPTVVLHYPSRKELIRELKKNYDYVGISFIIPTFHRMKEIAVLVREYSPGSRIILGGYGTALPDDVLKPYGDYICREEGVAFMRRLLGQTEISMPYKHPLIESEMKIFSSKVSRTGMIFAGLGCPNGCDFCCTSHFFKRRHIRLLPTGKDIYAVIERYLAGNADSQFTIIDEDFLLDRRRAMQLREKVLEAGKPLSIFAFSSIRALSQYTPMELLETGISGVWIGYEGTRSGYGKQKGKPASTLFRELREYGITVLTSMILGFDYQTPEIIFRELEELLELKPALVQFLIYGPPPGTPFYERVLAQGLLRREYADDREKFYRASSGFKSMVRHPVMQASEIETIQKRCFERDYEKLGPSIYRVVETWLLGYRNLKNSPNAFLRLKAQSFASEIRNAYPIFLAGRWLGSNIGTRRWIKDLESRVHAEIGLPSLKERFLSLFAVAAALWTGLLDLFRIRRHPALLRNSYRMPREGLWPVKLLERLREESVPQQFSVQIELQHAKQQVWVRLEGMLDSMRSERLGLGIQKYLKASRARLVLDFTELKSRDGPAIRALCERLKKYRKRVRIALPKHAPAHAAEFLCLLGMFKT